MMTHMQQTFVVPTESLGDRLRRARVAADLSVAELADELEVSRTSISRWENNHDRPRRATVLAYAMRCSVPIEWLEGDSKNRWFSLDFLAVAA